MIKNAVFALVAALGLSAPSSFAGNTPINNVPPNTITIRARVDKKDIVTIRGDKLWIDHISGQWPTNIQVNGNSWTPTWDDEHGSNTFTMNNPARFLPMTERRGFISMSSTQTSAVAAVLDYPDYMNEWMLVISLDNSESAEPSYMSITISWKNEDPFPVVLPNHVVPYTKNMKASPTPVGLR